MNSTAHVFRQIDIYIYTSPGFLLMMLKTVPLDSIIFPNDMSIFMNEISNTSRSRKQGKVWYFITCASEFICNKTQKNGKRYLIWEYRCKILLMRCLGIYWEILQIHTKNVIQTREFVTVRAKLWVILWLWWLCYL